MLLRLMFVLLIALNIAVAAWLLLGESGTHAVDPVDKGVPKLKLLAEIPAPASTAPAVSGSAATSALAAAAGAATAPAPAMERSTAIATPPVAPAATSAKPLPRAPEKKAPAETPAAPALLAAAPSANAPTSAKRSYRCLAIGPFTNQVDLRSMRAAIAARTVRSRQRQEQTSESHGWRVFLPAQATRDLALAQARRLEAKGIKDYFVVTATGELQNSVALGLFHDPANAKKRRDEVIAAGFPARMAERTEITPVWWLDVVVPDDANADVRRGIRSPGASAKPTGCF
ncbi:MAG TPA: SPOR domain-containing protein [Luteibacter sp.]|uniref:SPOR domain-containing protein n=1 Tax=Luteibacter sp. TaxID=1886636 RepID=UPI002CDF2A3E|nr:SPOR domain-containing protein [Luteibacter sp.]HVI53913.1 SPOR domain-containing protein [Luteibacter sp.]